MNIIIKRIKNNKLLSFVILAYLTLSIFSPITALESVKNSLYYVKEMLIIMPVILLLTSLIEAWVPKKTIENNLGVNSGFKGPIFSFLLGSFSAGPIYAAFPICKMLLKKGGSVANIVIILSTWAVIKVPMLVNEAKFLGSKFMVIRWILTSISIFIIAYIISRLVKKSEIPMDDLDDNSKDTILKINEKYCIGCGLCAKISPENFIVKDKKANAVKKDINEGEIDTIIKAVEKCPAKCIEYRNIFK